MVLYMAVTPDEYELPLTVETSVTMLAKKYNTTPYLVSKSIWKNNSGARRGVRFVKVLVD